MARGAGHKAKRVAGGHGGRQGPSPPFHCALCQLQVNSETQLKQVGEVGPGLGLSRADGVGQVLDTGREPVEAEEQGRRDSGLLEGKGQVSPPLPRAMPRKCGMEGLASRG